MFPPCFATSLCHGCPQYILGQQTEAGMVATSWEIATGSAKQRETQTQDCSMETINTAHVPDEQFCIRQGGWAKDILGGFERDPWGLESRYYEDWRG